MIMRAGKPENSRTVRQWALRGRIPVEGAKPSYIWDNALGEPRSIYYLDVDTREMTQDEAAAFQEEERIKKERQRDHMKKMRAMRDRCCVQ
uniref:hypothetical protein n=1 Tax=Agathobacter sp. TaxID=2021311 RepID=UPI004057755D